MMSGLPMIQPPKKISEGCVISKHHRKKFVKEALHKARQLFGVVYSDVCGPFSVKSLGGNNYLVVFVERKERSVLHVCSILQCCGEIFRETDKDPQN